MAAAGLVPALNVKDADTQSEFDIYAFRASPTSVQRVMVQCSHPAPRSEKLSALKGYAPSFGADDCLYVTATKPHPTQSTLAQRLGVALITEDHRSRDSETVIAGCAIDVQAPLSAREEAIIHFLRCLARLRRVALGGRSRHPACETVVNTWNALDGVPLIADPFERIERLYQIHYSAPNLAEDCALSEGLAAEGPPALKQAYAYNGGTYTQSALALQTLNRVQTLISLCECACQVSAGAVVPDFLDQEGGRRGPIIRSLAQKPYRHLLGAFAFEFVFGWGGFWPAQCETEVKSGIAAALGCPCPGVDLLVQYVDSLYKTEGMGQFVKRVGYGDVWWHNMLLLPFFAKGIGLLRIQDEGGSAPSGSPWDEWRADVLRRAGECELYERDH